MLELILFGTFFGMLLLSVPVAFSLGLAAFATVIYMSGTRGLASLPNVMYAQMSTETLLAIPFFVLAGTIMEYAGISERLIRFADTMVGHRKSGMALVTVIAAFFFAAISGSGPATVAALGTILIPALVRRGYRPGDASALMASAGSMGIVVPPSITLIIYGVLANEYGSVSIGRLFMGGVLPGLLMATLLFVAAKALPRVEGTVKLARDGSIVSTHYTSFIRHGKPEPIDTIYRMPGSTEAKVTESKVTMVDAKPSSSERWKAFVSAIPGLLVPVIILGGIYGGIFTPTEAAVVSVFYALLVGFVFYRDLKIGDVPKMFTSAAIGSAVIMIIVGAASMVAYVITRGRVADTVSKLLLGISTNPIVVMLLVIILLLIVGCLMDAVSALYLFVPLLTPVLLKLGYDNTTIGVMMTVNLAVGMVTPPVGVNLFVAGGISKLKLWEIAKGVPRFFIAGLITILCTAFIPALSNFLPDLLGM